MMLHSRTTIWRAWMARATSGASVLALSLCLTTNTHAQQELVEKVTDPSQPAVAPNGSSSSDGRSRKFFGVDPITGERSVIRFLEQGGPRVLDLHDDGKLKAGGTNVRPLSGTIRAFVGIDPNTGKINRIQFLGTGTTPQVNAPGNQSKSPVDTLEQFHQFKRQGISGKKAAVDEKTSESAIRTNVEVPDHEGASWRVKSQVGWYNADGTLDEDQVADSGDKVQQRGFVWFNADGTRNVPKGVGVKTPGGFAAQQVVIGLDDPFDGSGISPAPTERKILGPVLPDSLRSPITTRDADRKSAAEPESP